MKNRNTVKSGLLVAIAVLAFAYLGLQIVFGCVYENYPVVNLQITNPTNTQCFYKSATAPGITARYINGAGNPGGVYLYVDGVGVGTFSGVSSIGCTQYFSIQFPNWKWTNMEYGTHILSAVNEIVYGNGLGVQFLASSDPVQFVILDPNNTNVFITSPADGSAFNEGDSITVAASAVDFNKVEFYDGNSLIYTSLSSAPSFQWKNVTCGSHTLKAKAYLTSAGTTATSAPVNITVDPPPKGNLYAGAYPFAVYRYNTDGTWSNVFPHAFCLAVDGWNNLGQIGWRQNMDTIVSLCEYNGALYAAGHITTPCVGGTFSEAFGGKVWKYNGGTNWTQIGTNLPVDETSSLAVFNGQLYVSCNGLGVYRLDGTNWTLVKNAPYQFMAKTICSWNDMIYGVIGDINYDYLQHCDGINGVYGYDIISDIPYFYELCDLDFAAYNGKLYVGYEYSDAKQYGGHAGILSCDGEPDADGNMHWEVGTNIPTTLTCPYSGYYDSVYISTLEAFKDSLYIGVGPCIVKYNADSNTLTKVWNESATDTCANFVTSMLTTKDALFFGTGWNGYVHLEGNPGPFNAQGKVCTYDGTNVVTLFSIQTNWVPSWNVVGDPFKICADDGSCINAVLAYPNTTTPCDSSGLSGIRTLILHKQQQ